MNLLRAVRNGLEAGNTAAIDLAISMLSRVKIVDLTEEEAQSLGELARIKTPESQAKQFTVLVQNHKTGRAGTYLVTAGFMTEAVRQACSNHGIDPEVDTYNFAAVQGDVKLCHDFS